jgi:hypothetical protein
VVSNASRALCWKLSEGFDAEPLLADSSLNWYSLSDIENLAIETDLINTSCHRVYAKEFFILNHTRWATVSALFCASVGLITFITSLIPIKGGVTLDTISVV